MKKQDIINKIDKRIRYFEKHFDRYRKEVDKVNEEGEKSPGEYSDHQSYRMLSVMDELGDLRIWIEKQ